MAKLLRIFKNEYFWLLLIILVALVLRLYKINSPIADWHSWRQADSAAVTRNFVQESFNPFLPRGDDMSGIAEDPIANLGRYRLVEFPIYNIVTYPFYVIFGVNVFFSRLVSVLFSLGSIVFLYLIAKKNTSVFTGLVAALTMALLPYEVYFSRTTLPEPTFVFFSLGMIFFTDRWLSKNKLSDFWLGIIFTAAAFLIKPFVGVLFIPLGYLMYQQTGSWLPKGKNLLFMVLSLLPLLLWRIWILQHPEGIPASNWLFNGDHIRFHPSFWWWLLSERLGHEILGVTGFFLFFLGLIRKPKQNYFFHFWALSMFLYLVVVATGNIRHDYYQYMIVPIMAIFLSIGFTSLLSAEFMIARFWTTIIALLFFTLTFYFGWIPVREFYKINNPAIVEAGLIADHLLPKNAVVIAPYNADSAFLYQINRNGFPLVIEPIPKMVSEFGVTSYVSISHDPQTSWVSRHFQVLVDTPNFVIADLTKPKGKLYDSKDPEP